MMQVVFPASCERRFDRPARLTPPVSRNRRFTMRFPELDRNRIDAFAGAAEETMRRRAGSDPFGRLCELERTAPNALRRATRHA